jgi:hypothetical protein
MADRLASFFIQPNIIPMRYATALAALLVGHFGIAQSSTLKPVAVKYMVRGYFYASSQGPAELNGHGGWGRSSNGSARFIPSAGAIGLQVLVDTSSVVPLDSLHEGRRVTVRNNGPDTIYFPAQDSRLYMKAQAKQGGVFRDIEYLPSSWCGNSYHTLFLAPGEQWQFVMPNYSGPLKTSLRLELAYRTTAEGDDEKLLYSHPFPGSVHPKQFSEKKEYQPGGLMDPYND